MMQSGGSEMSGKSGDRMEKNIRKLLRNQLILENMEGMWADEIADNLAIVDELILNSNLPADVIENIDSFRGTYIENVQERIEQTKTKLAESVARLRKSIDGPTR